LNGAVASTWPTAGLARTDDRPALPAVAPASPTTDATLDVRSVHSCTGVRDTAPGEPADAAEFADADVPSETAVPGPAVSDEPTAGRPASALPVDVDPEPLKATVPAVAAPPAATRPASDHATTFIEIRFTSGRFGIFLFLGVTA